MNNYEDLYKMWVEQCGFGDADTPELRHNYNSGTEHKVSPFPPSQTQEVLRDLRTEWEKEFDELWPEESLAIVEEAVAYGEPVAIALQGELTRYIASKNEKRAAVKLFVRSLLASQRKTLLREVEDNLNANAVQMDWGGFVQAVEISRIRDTLARLAPPTDHNPQL